jgi:hypothetical protein
MKEPKFYNKELIELFNINVDDYFIFRIFLDSRFGHETPSLRNIEKQRKDIIKILSQPSFINEFNFILNKYINESDNPNKNKTLVNFRNAIEKLNPKSTSKDLIYIIKNTELLGDIILYYIVNEIIIRTSLSIIRSDERMKTCQTKLKNFLNSNVFLYNIIKKLTSLNIYDFLPDDFKYDIRLTKRLTNVDSKRIEQENKTLSPDCIVLKFYANLLEQTIGYTFIKKGYKITQEIFLNILKKTGFIPEDFIKNCLEIRSKPYDGMVLQTGCSCKDQENNRICDNPGYFDPKSFKNSPCPLGCSQPDIQQFINSIRDIQIHILNTHSKNDRENMIKSIANQSNLFFINYIFNWKKSPYILSNTYFYFILDYIINNRMIIGVSNSILDFVKKLQNDIKIYQNEYLLLLDPYDSESNLEEGMYDLIQNKNITFPRALAIYQRYSILDKNIRKDENKLLIGILNNSFSNMISNYKSIIEPKPSIFTIGTKQPNKDVPIPRRGRTITNPEKEKYPKSTRPRSRSSSREEKRRKSTPAPVAHPPVAPVPKFVIGQDEKRSSTKKISSRSSRNRNY